MSFHAFPAQPIGAPGAGVLTQSVHIDDEMPDLLLLDATRLHQILLNLVGNAIKFTEEGHVEIHAQFLGGESPLLRCQVIDTGIGMSEEEQREIFEPFRQSDMSGTRQHEGTGLGLTISSRIAEQLGGSIDVESTLGEGSKFTVEVPTEVRTASASQEPAAGSGDEEPFEQDLRAHILVVDDNDEIRHLVRQILESAGATVTTVSRAAKALDEVRQANGDDPPFDLVLMDMQMPDMDGYDATRRLRELGFERPIVALTAAAMSGDEQRCFEAGCTGYLTKPIEPPTFTSKLAEFIDER